MKAKVFIIIFLLFIIFPSKIDASLVSINKEGKVLVKVLSSEDSIELEIPQSEYLEVTNIAKEIPDPEAKILLSKDEGKISLLVSAKSGEKSLDVTNYKQEVIEIEERPEKQKLTIAVSADKFSIKQEDIVAETDFNININLESAKLSLETPSGFKFLSILPKEAAETILRTKLINRLNKGTSFLLTETQEGDLSYKITGEKVINFFNIFDYAISVKTTISASTGEILSIDEPSWLKVFSFLFV